MSYSNFGFKSNVRSIVSPSISTPKSIEPNIIEVRVIKSITTMSDSKSNNLPVGAIIGESTDSNNVGKTFIANPLNSNITNVPVVGELVDLYKSSIPNSNGKQWLYGHPKGAYGTTSVNSNSVSSKLKTSPPTTQSTVKNYQASTLGIPITQPTPPKSNPTPSIEDPKISSLEPNPGDIIYEGRHGQSLRLGNTNKNPIIILRNGQNPNQPISPGEQIKENIQGDISSLYLTSNQKISNLDIANSNFNSFGTTPKPESPSSYIGPQSILNSDRVILNAKKDSILISGNKSLFLSSNESINLESDKIYTSCKDIRLGAPSAEESALLGDSTIEILQQLTHAIKSLANILLVEKNWPEGVLATSLNSVANDVISSIEDSKYGIETILNNGSLKSKSTKLI